ncbi:MAG: serine/threonine protein kinase, partial [Lachnospiraceae bacterium]|nr:serine/threonine protein kinase [Lachnospiraceae bacterium]
MQNKYELGEIIGRGGTGNVYEAYDLHLRQVVAVKQIVDGMQDAIREETLWNEVAMLKQLSHPALPQIYDYFWEEDCAYMVLEYIGGVTLEQYVRENGPLGQRQSLKMMKQLLSVFSYLHSFSPPVIFRDLKPTNIMIKEGGMVKLIDFGTAIYQATDRGLVAGTPGFSAPELFVKRGGRPGRINSDIYSLGAVFYYLLTARIPPSVHDNWWLGRQRLSMGRYDRAVDSGIKRIIRRCLQIKPERRYAGVGQLKMAIKNYRDLSGYKIIRKSIGRMLRRSIPVIGMILMIRAVMNEGSLAGGIASWKWQGEEGLSDTMAGGMILLLAGMYGCILAKNKKEPPLKREKSLFLTAKKVVGLWGGGALIVCLLTLMLFSRSEAAGVALPETQVAISMLSPVTSMPDSKELAFVLRDSGGHKLLVKRGSAYRPTR